jgi:hypothetical protein
MADRGYRTIKLLSRTTASGVHEPKDSGALTDIAANFNLWEGASPSSRPTGLSNFA